MKMKSDSLVSVQLGLYCLLMYTQLLLACPCLSLPVLAVKGASRSGVIMNADTLSIRLFSP